MILSQLRSGASLLGTLLRGCSPSGSAHENRGCLLTFPNLGYCGIPHPLLMFPFTLVPIVLAPARKQKVKKKVTRQLVCIREEGFKERWLAEWVGWQQSVCGNFFSVGYEILSKGSIYLKIGSMQTTNQFSFVLYASLKKKICNIM